MKNNLKSGLLHGRVHGKAIELDEAIDIPDGVEVEIVVRPVQRFRPWGEGLKRSAGALADSWTEEDDEILEKLHRDRERTTPRENPERAICSTPTSARPI